MKKIIYVSLASICIFLFYSYDAHAFTFGVIGDTQDFHAGKKGGLQSAAKNLKKAGVNFSVMIGDTGCKDKTLKKWQNAASQLFPNIYPAHGNHDSISSSKWRQVFNPPTNGPSGYIGWAYSFDYENSHFVVLDSDRSRWHLVDATQRQWLETDLSGNTKENTFIFFHEPAFPVGHKITSSLDALPEERDALWEILDRHNVTAVFSGHEHIFSRKLINSSVFPTAQHSIYQFIVGNTDAYSHSKPRRPVEYYYRGKSYLIVQVDVDQITTSLYSTKGKLLNTLSFPN